ncbi:MAG: sulfite exporter TauE/SafE family protein [Paracoccaceae bacterium]
MIDWLGAHSLFSSLPVFALAVLAVAMVGLSKGGLGGAFSMMGVPVLTLAMSPLLAAALMLPILLIMDARSLWIWRHYRDTEVLRVMIPWAIAGIAIGWLASTHTPDAAVRLILGVIAVTFAARGLFGRYLGGAPRYRAGTSWFWGTIAGFTSFVAHAGGPPFQAQVLPKRLDPKVYTGTNVVFFAVINAIKTVPYAGLGMFETRTLVSAALMAPVALVAVQLGAMIVRRLSAAVFYPFSYAMMLIIGIKLVYDGVSAF